MEIKKKVVLIDPWGIASTSEYLNGLIYGLSSLVDLTVFTNYYFQLKIPSNVEIKRVFFKNTEKMKQGTFRKCFRGVEYIGGYRNVIKYLKKQGTVDVIHINWLLSYQLDIHFLKKLRKYTNKLVYTAHNVVPHINGEDSIVALEQIYSMCDRIILHGESIKTEFSKYFQEYVDKIFIQKHGSNLIPKIGYDEKTVLKSIKLKVESYQKKYIFFGRIFYNKGADRLISAWNKNWNDTLLIVAGHVDDNYAEFEALRKLIEKQDNILLLDEFVDDNTLNYLISKSEIILLPYRHASMSGVVFTAADFNKTVLCTRVGALPEYLKNEEDSFIVDNTDEAILQKLNFIHDNVSCEDLQKMGKNLSVNIQNECAWTNVANKLVTECYL